LRSRAATLTLVFGVIAGMLIAGLAVPLLFGTPLTAGNVTPLTAAGTPAPGASGAGGDVGGPGGAGATDAGGAAGGGGGGASNLGGASAAYAAGGGAGGASRRAPGGAGSSAGFTGSPAPAGVTLTASDRGVTPTTVKVAFLVVDLGSISKLGFGVPGFDPKTQEAFDNAFIDDVNAHGGILGRKIVPFYESYDPTSADSETAACVKATQDDQVFATVDVSGGLNPAAQLCFTKQNNTPVLSLGSLGETEGFYQQAGGYLFTIYESGMRALGNLSWLLATRGLLKGKHIGILDRSFPGNVQTVTDGAVKVLAQYGYQVAYRADLSADDGTDSSQVPVAVQQFRSHGVDAILLLTEFITTTQFVQQADKAGYTPQYFASDFESQTNDTAIAAMPASFRATALTTSRQGEWRKGVPEPAVDHACRKTYAARTGQDVPPSTSNYQGVVNACGEVDLFARAAAQAGTNLTRQGLAAALQNQGDIAFPFFNTTSFRPGKFDGADSVRLLTSDPGCTCWMPTGAFVDPKY
jgi:ABC-type branched-subunit amino acid transport system substrate-binding protein